MQVLRTYPAIRPKTPYAPNGERSVARGYGKAFRRARRLIYLEDQYMWSPHIARLLADALRRNPELHLIVVVPRHPDVDGRFALPPNEVGRLEAIQVACRRSRPDRVHVFDLENPPARRSTCTRRSASSTTCGRARAAPTSTAARGATTASCRARYWTRRADEREPRDPAGLGDGARRFARDLRLTLMREHLDRADGDDADLLDPDDAVRAVTAAADALDAWHTGGRVGPRPPGRLRPHRPEKLPLWTRVWAVPAYRLVLRPGRPVGPGPPAPALVSGVPVDRARAVATEMRQPP